MATHVLITRREWARVLFFALALALLTSAPYVLAWASQGDDRVFSGFLFGADDGNSYIGKMRLGAQGHWDFFLFYTAEEHDSANLLFLPYILPGQIVRLFLPDTDLRLTGTLIGIFHLMRIVFGILLIAVIYRFIAAFLRSSKGRFLALMLATLGGGFGWLLMLAGQGDLPPEFYIPEGFTFQILFGLPHLALARSALLIGFLALFSAVGAQHAAPTSPNERVTRLRRAFRAGLCWLLVGLAVPFYLVIIYCILGAWGLAVWLRSRTFPMWLFRCCLVAAGLTLPLFLYSALVFAGNPAFALWSAQNLLPSPSPFHYVLAYLPLALLAFMGGFWAWRRAKIDPHYALLVGWPLIVPVLVYLPINVQRRMAEAVIVPLSILASAGVTLLVAKWRRKRSHRAAWRWLSALSLLATVPVTLFLLLGGFLAALSGASPTFYPAGEITAFNWLNQHSAPGEVVLSAFETGNRIPAYTNLRVYVGHGPETLYAVPKTRQVVRFFRRQMPANERETLFERMRIRYIFYGPTERRLTGDSSESPEWAEDLNPIYSSGEWTIYEIAP